MERVGMGFSGGLSPKDIVECVQLAEQLGYESAWVAEGHAPARACIEARLASPDLLVEVGIIAAR